MKLLGSFNLWKGRHNRDFEILLVVNDDFMDINLSANLLGGSGYRIGKLNDRDP